MRRWRSLREAAYTFVLLPSVLSSAYSEEFIRGDANSDGVVSIADPHFINNWIYRSGADFLCEDAADATDDGEVTVRDSFLLLNRLIGGPDPKQPFSAPGLDPTESESLDCDSYGSGNRVVDASARLEILDAVPDRDGTVEIAVLYTSEVPIAGLSGRIRHAGGLLVDVGQTLREVASGASVVQDLTRFGGATHVRDETGVPTTIEFGLLETISGDDWLEAGEHIAIVTVVGAIDLQTKPGEYPLTLEFGELVNADTAESIDPDLRSGRILVPSDLNVRFTLGDATASAGDSVTVPFLVQADRASTGFSYSIDFDEAVLEYIASRRVYERADGADFEFSSFEADADHGVLVGAAVISLADTGDVLPPFEDVTVLEFDFQVASDADPGVTEIRFEDGARNSAGEHVRNALLAEGSRITPDVAASFVLVGGRVSIIGDLTAFVRGDSNGDGVVDISDPQMTLNYLFQGERRPVCLDAADANDDGSVDVSDAVATLEFLFVGGEPLPEPRDESGEDPTPDGIACR